MAHPAFLSNPEVRGAISLLWHGMMRPRLQPPDWSHTAQPRPENLRHVVSELWQLQAHDVVDLLEKWKRVVLDVATRELRLHPTVSRIIDLAARNGSGDELSDVDIPRACICGPTPSWM